MWSLWPWVATTNIGFFDLAELHFSGGIVVEPSVEVSD